jgi:hypothetical protein
MEEHRDARCGGLGGGQCDLRPASIGATRSRARSVGVDPKQLFSPTTGECSSAERRGAKACEARKDTFEASEGHTTNNRDHFGSEHNHVDSRDRRDVSC